MRARLPGRPWALAAALVVAGGLALPAAATTASLTLDRPCYVSGQSGTLRLAGFTPGAAVAVASSELGATTVTADAAGSATVTITPPPGDEPAAREIDLTATQADGAGATAQARALAAPRAFATATGTTSPKQPRAWRFAGWTPQLPLYAHFRLEGRTRGTHRFGVATGPCGELTARAPVIGVRGPIAPGVWRIQVDHSPTFSPGTRPAVVDEAVVFPTFR